MKIGQITYATADAQHVVLNVEKSPSKQGLHVELVPALPYEVRIGIGHLDRIVNRSIRGIYDNFSSIFGEKRIRETLTEMVAERTFFEDEKAYDILYGNAIEDDGTYIPDGKKLPDGRIIKPGSHIQIYGGSFKTELTLMHEWGHELHDRSCTYNIAPLTYNSYDDEIHEVLAILVEKLVGEDEHVGPPHETANDLVIRISKFGKFLREEKNIETSLRDAWMFLLNFSNHKACDFWLSRLERLYPPKTNPET